MSPLDMSRYKEYYVTEVVPNMGVGRGGWVGWLGVGGGAIDGSAVI